ncbi:MAG: hypothetical protein WA823_13825 [Candidatus Acidiferrales bacterium]
MLLTIALIGGLISFSVLVWYVSTRKGRYLDSTPAEDKMDTGRVSRLGRWRY